MQLPGSNISIPTHGRAHTGAQHKDNEFINIIRIRLNISKLNCNCYTVQNVFFTSEQHPWQLPLPSIQRLCTLWLQQYRNSPI